MKKSLQTKKLLSVLLSLALLCGILPLGVFSASADDEDGWNAESAGYSGYFENRTDANSLGTGIETDPYIIQNVDELFILAAEVNGVIDSNIPNSALNAYNKAMELTDENAKAAGDSLDGAQPFANAYFKMADGFDNSATALTTPIGISPPFCGNLNGNGQTINLKISTSINAGLFGYTSGNVSIKDLTVTGSVSADVNGGYAGGFVGYNRSTFTATNCYNQAKVSANGNSSMAGGFVGLNVGTFTATNCYNSAEISSEDNAGGFVGLNVNTFTATNCYNQAEVYGNVYAGGFVGQNNSTFTATNCYNQAEVYGNVYAGGFVGQNNVTFTATNCYNSAEISADGNNSNAGGFVGYNRYTFTATNCYYDKDTCSCVKTEGLTGLTTAEMKSDGEDGLLKKLNGYVDEYNEKEENKDKTKLETWVIAYYINDGYPIFKGEYDKLTETTQSNIAITIPTPQAGEKLGEATIDFNSTGITLNHDTIWMDDDDSIVKSAKCGIKYTASIDLSLSINEGYRLAKSAKVTATINNEAVELTNYGDGYYTVEYTFDKVQHVWDNGRVVERPTTTEEGTRLCTCTVCNATKTEAIEKLKEEVKPIIKSTQKIKFLNLSSLTKTFNASSLKRSKRKFAIVANANTKLTYTKVKGSKRLRLNKKLGNVIVKKGTKAGSYKIRVRITAQETESYKKARITKIIRVIVR